MFYSFKELNKVYDNNPYLVFSTTKFYINMFGTFYNFIFYSSTIDLYWEFEDSIF